MTGKQGAFVHCKTIRVESGDGLVQKSVKGNLGRIDDDPVFSTVYRSGTAFFGKSFPCSLLDRFMDPHPSSECALVPILIGPAISIFFYARTSKSFTGVTCHHYLELLSWVVDTSQPPTAPVLQGKDRGVLPHAPQNGAKKVEPQKLKDDGIRKRIAKMVGRIKDLPPLPNIVSSAMQMLSDVETPVEEIEAVISQDQALVANLIKVGNSALYGGLQKATTLRQILARLGLKTTRNLILTASARGYFLNNQKGMRVWGQNLWQHSVESGLAARRIADTIHYSEPVKAALAEAVIDDFQNAELMVG